MTGVRRTRGPGGLAAAGLDPWPLVLCGVMVAAFAVAAVIWLGGVIASWLSATPNTVSFDAGIGLLVDLVTGGGPTGLWDQVPPALLYGSIASVAVVALGVGAVAWQLVVRVFGRRPMGFATAADLKAFCEKARMAEARRLRPSLEGKRDLAGGDIGLPLGSIPGAGLLDTPTLLWIGLEDTTTSWMAPRSGKTTSLAVPQVIAAPGPVVATSNKADLWASTARIRARNGSRVWTFDPQAIAHEPCSWFWNPLTGVDNFELAQNLAAMFISANQDGDNRNQYFTDRARLYLTYLLLAAASGPTPNLAEVDYWLDHNRDPEPVTRLGVAGQANAQRALAAMVSEDSGETIEGVFSTARTATGCFKSEAIMRWVTPSRERPAFVPDEFVCSTDSLYLLSRDGDLSAAPLVAAFVDRLFRAGRERAEASVGNRLDPPLVTVLDEAANIVKIPTLPDNYSYFGGIGVLVHAIFQSVAQARGAWGKVGAEKLWGASTVKVIGSGMDDPELANTLAKFIGDHEIDTRSVSYSGRTGSNQQISTQKEQIWTPADIRELPQGQALVFGTGLRPALVALQPWYEGPLAEQLSADTAAQFEVVQQRAKREQP